MVIRHVARPALAGLCLLLSGMGNPAFQAKADEPDAKTVAQAGAQPALPTAALTTAAGQAVSAAAPSADQYANWIGKKFQRGPATGKMIALTFDDGPNPRTTPRVLEILAQNKITATFFQLGELVEKNPELTKRIFAAGHEIGSHTWSHKNLRALDYDGARREVISAQDVIQQVTGVRPRLFRPPYGNVNANVTKIAKDDGLVMVMWAVDSNDWRPNMNAEKLRERVKTQNHPGAVLLFHDIQERTITALPGMLEDMKAAGYQFVTVTKLIEEANEHPQAEQGGGGDMGMGAEMEAPARPLSIPLSQTN